MSAGSKTNPGGYANREQALSNLRFRTKGALMKSMVSKKEWIRSHFQGLGLVLRQSECLKGTFHRVVAGKSGKETWSGACLEMDNKISLLWRETPLP